MSEEEIFAKLSDLREQAVNIIKEYNILARNNNQNTRMAHATAEAYADKENENFEKIVEKSWGENVGISIDSPEANAWFPSSIC